MNVSETTAMANKRTLVSISMLEPRTVTRGVRQDARNVLETFVISGVRGLWGGVSGGRG